MNRKPLVMAFVTANVLIGLGILLFAIMNSHWWLVSAPLILFGYTFFMLRKFEKISKTIFESEIEEEESQQFRLMLLAINFVLMLFVLILFFIGLRDSIESYMFNKGQVGTCIAGEGCTPDQFK